MASNMRVAFITLVVVVVAAAVIASVGALYMLGRHTRAYTTSMGPCGVYYGVTRTQSGNDRQVTVTFANFATLSVTDENVTGVFAVSQCSLPTDSGAVTATTAPCVPGPNLLNKWTMDRGTFAVDIETLGCGDALSLVGGSAALGSVMVFDPTPSSPTVTFLLNTVDIAYRKQPVASAIVMRPLAGRTILGNIALSDTCMSAIPLLGAEGGNVPIQCQLPDGTSAGCQRTCAPLDRL